MNNRKTLLLPDTPDGIEQAADLLRAGEIVGFPTETVYGLGASVFDEDAIQKIFEAKSRPTDNPLIIHCAERHDVNSVAIHIPQMFDILTQHFSPGPLTMILEKHNAVPTSVCAGLPTVAVRFPRHPIAQQLIRLVGKPLVAPSANRSGYISPTKASHVLDDLNGRIAAVIDGGTCRVGVESTVLNILRDPPVILRPGTIKKQDLENVLGMTIAENFSAEPFITPQSPGTKYRHYQPEATLILVSETTEAKKLADERHKNPVLLTATQPVSGFIFINEQNLYEILREADKNQIKTIIMVCDKQSQNNTALMNRLQKAATLSLLPELLPKS